MLSRIKFDVDILVKDILNQLPEEVWISNSTRFFDPAIGGGQFVRAIEKRLRSYGHSDDNIRDRVYGFEESSLHIKFAINKYKLVGQYVCLSYEKFFDLDNSMKFDVIVGNPPYQGKAALHQQFFNKSYSLLNDNGYLAFIQPATTYFNKKEKQKAPVDTMMATVKSNKCNITIVGPEVFENAIIRNDLSITVLNKCPSGNSLIEEIKYKNGTKFNNVALEDITMTQLDPVIYRSIRIKYENFISTFGCLEDKVSKDVTKLKAPLAKIRGNAPSDCDFYTFIPKREAMASTKVAGNYYNDFGILAKSKTEVENIYDYLTSYVARFGLAILKFSQNTLNKEFNSVPLVPFNKTYTDDELYKMLDLTDDEINAIKKVIVDYHGR